MAVVLLRDPLLKKIQLPYALSLMVILPLLRRRRWMDQTLLSHSVQLFVQEDQDDQHSIQE